MKKLRLLLCFLLCLSITSCNKSKDELEVIESRYELKETIEINKEELENKLEGDSFILYIYTEGCSSCEIFENNELKEYIEETNAVIYKTSFDNTVGLIKTNKKYDTNPRICIIKEGVLIDQVTEKQNRNLFRYTHILKEYIGRYFVINPIKTVSLEQLNNLFNEKEKMSVYFRMTGCQDCKYFEENTYFPYLLSHKDDDINDFYVYEVNELRKYKDSIEYPEKAKMYEDFVDLFSLDILGNKGKYPSLINYSNKTRNKYCVYFNDELEYNETNKTYTVLNTPYNDGSIIGETYSSYSEYQDKTNEFHYGKFIEFMES